MTEDEASERLGQEPNGKGREYCERCRQLIELRENS